MLLSAAVVVEQTGTPWWDVVSALGTLAAVVVALGLAWHEQRLGNRREQIRDIEKEISDLDETRRLIMVGSAGGMNQLVTATVMNSLRYHSNLLPEDEEQAFRVEWSRAGTVEGGVVDTVIARLTAWEMVLRAKKDKLAARRF